MYLNQISFANGILPRTEKNKDREPWDEKPNYPYPNPFEHGFYDKLPKMTSADITEFIQNAKDVIKNGVTLENSGVGQVIDNAKDVAKNGVTLKNFGAKHDAVTAEYFV